MYNQTFGQFLKKVLDKRDLSTRSLAGIMGLKSKTQITRLLDDSCTIKTIEAFAEKLKNSLELSKKEMSDMEEAILNHGTSQALIKSRGVLQTLLTGKYSEASKKIQCFLKNGCDEIDEQYNLGDALARMIEQNKNAEIEVYIRNINSMELVCALTKIIHRQPTPKLTVHHYFSDGESVEDIGILLCGLLNLATFEGYYPYRLPEGMRTGSGLVVFVNGGEKTTLINVFGEKNFSEITDTFPESMYKHIKKSYERLSSISSPLKNSFKSDPLEKLSAFIEDQIEKDCVPSIELASTLCFMMVPFHIQERLYKDSNYMGLGKDHPVVGKMVVAMKERAGNIFSTKKNKNLSLICTREGLERFLETGKTDDWFPFFRQLTPEEREETIASVRQNFSGNIHVLAKEYSVRNFECVVFQGHGIQICAPGAGYWSNFSTVDITDRRMERLLNDFLANDVIRNCCIGARDMKKLWLDIDRKIAKIKEKRKI